MLPRRIPQERKRERRWRSPAHASFVRGFCCAMCGSTTNIEAAHVRLGSGAGIGQKPDDWRVVPLCAGPNSNKLGQLGCHNRQHIRGEQSFWAEYAELHGQTIATLIEDLIAASPKRSEIRKVQREREVSLTSAPGAA